MTINITNRDVENKIKELANHKRLKYVQAVNLAVTAMLNEEKPTTPTPISVLDWLETHVWLHVDPNFDTSKEALEKLLGY